VRIGAWVNAWAERYDIPAASLEEAKIGGWGIHIVRRLTDELRYHRSAGRNHLTLIFRLPPP
jgi:serine/threonine-protein kinase RsbW